MLRCQKSRMVLACPTTLAEADEPRMTERIPCKTAGCSNTILRATAERTNGFCMPCVQAVAKKEREEYIRQNRRNVNEFDGITDPVESLKIIHKKRTYDPLVNWIPHPTPTDQLYCELSNEERLRFAGYVEHLIGSDRNDEAEPILLCLAAFTDAPLDGCLRRLTCSGSFWPSLPFSRASSVLRDQLIERLKRDDGNRNHILLALAWIGDEVVVDVFARWRDRPPDWRESLYIPPEDYSREAGWELTENGRRRNLYFSQCTKLLRGPTTSPDSFRAITDSRDSCPWCRQDLTNLVTLTPSAFGLLGGLVAARVQVTTCEACSTFGTVFGEFSEEGHGRWSAWNSRPEYLPDDSTDWGRLPRDPPPRRWLTTCAFRGRSVPADDVLASRRPPNLGSGRLLSHLPVLRQNNDVPRSD